MTMTTRSPEPDPALSAEDLSCIDELTRAGFRVDLVSANRREQAQEIRQILELLECGVSPDSHAFSPRQQALAAHLVAVGLVANGVAGPDASSAQTSANARGDVELSPGDEDALEALVAAEFDLRRVSSGVRARAQQQFAVLSMLDVAEPVTDAQRDDLVARSLASITTFEAHREQALKFGPPADAPLSRRTLRLPDIISVAAVMMLAVGLLWPALSGLRSQARQTACLGNFASVGSSLGQYRLDNRGSMPMASASIGGGLWWNVGSDPSQSNSANLYTSIRTGHARLDTLACPGNEYAVSEPGTASAQDWASFNEVSYSFMNLFGRPGGGQIDGFVTNPAEVVVLADRSPVVVRAFRGERLINVLENSLNHSGSGQAVHFLDGSARWTRSPMLESGDVIWIPRSLEEGLRLRGPLSKQTQSTPLRGREVPTNAEDGFVAP
ncbi:MAG: hypothetical protein ACK55O_07080 [Phycisphaerales bacterium]|jgi:hypothetical protein